jgi:dephospho-CoA kinase
MKAEIQRILEQAAARGERQAILNAALLSRMGLHELCTNVLFIDTPREICITRALGRGGRTREEIERIVDSQEDVNTSRNSADVVIGNAASPEEFRECLRAFARNYFGSQPDGNAPNAEYNAPRAQEGTLYP